MSLSLSRLFYVNSHFIIFHAYMYRVFCHKFCLLLLINGLLTCLRGPQGRLVPPIGSPSVNKVYLLTYLLTYLKSCKFTTEIMIPKETIYTQMELSDVCLHCLTDSIIMSLEIFRSPSMHVACLSNL